MIERSSRKSRPYPALLGCTVAVVLAVVLAVVVSMGLFLGCAILTQDSY